VRRTFAEAPSGITCHFKPTGRPTPKQTALSIRSTSEEAVWGLSSEGRRRLTRKSRDALSQYPLDTARRNANYGRALLAQGLKTTDEGSPKGGFYVRGLSSILGTSTANLIVCCRIVVDRVMLRLQVVA